MGHKQLLQVLVERRLLALPPRRKATHAVSGNPTLPPFPDGMQVAIFGMGCFWGAEQLFWRLPGVFSTQVGFAGGFTPNPTYEEVRSGMRQQEDVGTQYRSVIFTLGPEQHEAALRSRAAYQEELSKRRLGTITTAIEPAGDFFYAEDRHQQYLHKVPSGTCALRGTGVACPAVP
ncbi:PREDICTED: mitochondrial peptide methionine sulfoxide reductase-like [Tinamus guttatus]|uniref:mitochondrial peptide methionine sulfoxide reductase-like n=1 Tax=Tinamus guttatus TaxID=94827 RepID=UPI00052EE57D|nr:PREDICTED: mitochondrial peptide methionine sulfoxide reductase-like [Tinamus guttatus]